MELEGEPAIVTIQSRRDGLHHILGRHEASVLQASGSLSVMAAVQEEDLRHIPSCNCLSNTLSNVLKLLASNTKGFLNGEAILQPRKSLIILLE